MGNIEEIVRNALPVYKDWPKPGVNYLNTIDICRDIRAFRASIDWYFNIAATVDADYIFAADARGFIWGSVIAYKLGIPLHVVRKKNKMPGDLISQEYELEYGTDILEVQNLKLNSGTAIIIDDVLATGGTAEAICKLVHKLGFNYNSMTVACLINIKFLKGEEVLRNLGTNVKTLIDVNA